MDILHPLKAFSLENKVVFVTGASRGIGLAISIAMQNAGAIVVGVGRTEVEKVKKNVFEYMKCDVTSIDDVERVLNYVFARYKRLDVLVNSAGISRSIQKNSDKFKIFEETININLKAVYTCCEVAAKYIEKSGGGAIINITSIGSILGFPNNPSYVSSKGGVRMLTKSLAIDYNQKNIRVNNLVPGYIFTSMTSNSYKKEKEFQLRKKRTILNRWGKVEDIIGAAIFLGSDASVYITGQDIIVDGGWTAKGL